MKSSKNLKKMAILRNKELKELKENQVDNKLKELRKELIKIRSQIALGGLPENPGRTKELRRTIARIITFKKNKTKEVTKKA